MNNIIGNQQEFKDLVNCLKGGLDPSVVVILPPSVDERMTLKDGQNIPQISIELQNLFEELQPLTLNLMKKKDGTILFLYRSQIYIGNGHAYNPVQTQARLSLMLSLAKELAALNINVFGVVLAMDSNNLQQKQLIKEKLLDVVTLKYRAYSVEEQYEMIQGLLHNAKTLRGQSVSLGNPLPIYR
ncbi:MAG: hypothetical protein ABF969_08835 [Sporolactobacillus sp.]